MARNKKGLCTGQELLGRMDVRVEGCMARVHHIYDAPVWAYAFSAGIAYVLYGSRKLLGMTLRLGSLNKKFLESPVTAEKLASLRVGEPAPWMPKAALHTWAGGDTMRVDDGLAAICACYGRPGWQAEVQLPVTDWVSRSIAKPPAMALPVRGNRGYFLVSALPKLRELIRAGALDRPAAAGGYHELWWDNFVKTFGVIDKMGLSHLWRPKPVQLVCRLVNRRIDLQVIEPHTDPDRHKMVLDMATAPQALSDLGAGRIGLFLNKQSVGYFREEGQKTSTALESRCNCFIALPTEDTTPFAAKAMADLMTTEAIAQAL